MTTKIKIFLIIFFWLFFNQINLTKADFEISKDFWDSDTTFQSFDFNALSKTWSLNWWYFSKIVPTVYPSGDSNFTFNIYNQNWSYVTWSLIGPWVYYNMSMVWSIFTIDTKWFTYYLIGWSIFGSDKLLVVFDKYDKNTPFYFKHLSWSYNWFYFKNWLPFIKIDNNYISFVAPDVEMSEIWQIVTLSWQTFTEAPNSLLPWNSNNYVCWVDECVYLDTTNNTLIDNAFNFSNNILNSVVQVAPLPLDRSYYNYWKVAYIDLQAYWWNGLVWLSFADTINKKVSSYTFSYWSYNYFPDTWIHYYDYNKKNAFAIRNYWSWSDQIPYTFNHFWVNALWVYNNWSFWSLNSKYYLKDWSNSIWSTSFDPNLDWLSIYTWSLLPNGPVDPNYTPKSCEYAWSSQNLFLSSWNSKTLYYIEWSWSCLSVNLTCRDWVFYNWNIDFQWKAPFLENLDDCLFASTSDLSSSWSWTTWNTWLSNSDKWFFSWLIWSLTSSLSWLFDFSSKASWLSSSVIDKIHLNDFYDFLPHFLPTDPNFNIYVPFIHLEPSWKIWYNIQNANLVPVSDLLHISDISRNEIWVKFIVFFLALLLIFIQLILYFLVFLVFYLYNRFIDTFVFVIFWNVFKNTTSWNWVSSLFFIAYIVWKIAVFLLLFSYILQLKDIFTQISNFINAYFSFFASSFWNYSFFRTVVNGFFWWIYRIILLFITFIVINKFAKLN
jgi:hypothetical protein